MRPGYVLDERFEIEHAAAAGGMGQVYRARDRRSGEAVAVKVMLADAGSHAARFQHETAALATLSHPAIVRYVAHGTTESGAPYLAMEWLEGESLASRIERAGLDLAEGLSLAARVAEALGVAHARGIVHRDLKPSNVFLEGGRVDRAKLLDFGIARWESRTRITREGGLVGTPGYMAPEQVQSHQPVDARADVFSLGCVLFECLTGSAAFVADHPVALLSKVVFTEPPRLREVRPDAPEALERLLSRLLAKAPDERPANGTAAAEALLSLGGVSSGGGAPALTRGERRSLSVVLMAGAGGAERDLAPWPDQTLSQGEADLKEALRRGAEAWGGRLVYLRDGAVAVSIEGTDLATDRAAQAARCALWLREHGGGLRVALASGRGDTTSERGTGEIIDRAATMLSTRRDERGPGGPIPIAVDEVTARLLDGRFDVREADFGLSLHGEREMAEGARLLLRKATACVGRDRELSTLEQMVAECVEEPLAQAAIVTGGAGMGKSRLAQELLSRLRQSGATTTVWTGRGDPLRAGSPLGLLGQIVRSACGVHGDEPLAERRDKLLSRAAQHVGRSERGRVAEILGEIAGAPFPEDDSMLLRTARRNRSIMTDEMRRAWMDFLRAETASRPVLLVLEDLHWGDGATVRFIDGALRELADRPWMVLSLARPEVHEIFPRLWAERRTQEIALKPLARKASDHLVRQVLGAAVGEGTIERILARADGNPFYLEELIRAAAEHRGESLPETVIAMVQSRLATLEDEDRRVLRAAAVFGEGFWPGGVTALLGGPGRAAGLQARLLGLVDDEVLVKRHESRFAGEEELAFRHMLLREGAYSMLTPDDLAVGHRLAGEWLEQAGETDSKLLAEHFDRGGEAARAAAHYLRAAERAIEAGEWAAAVPLSERGVQLAHEPDLVADLRAAEAEAKLWTRDVMGSFHATVEAARAARPGSRADCRALLCQIAFAVFSRSREDPHQGPLGRLLRTDPEPDAMSVFCSAFMPAMSLLYDMGHREWVEEWQQRLEQVTASVLDQDPIAAAWVELSRAQYAGFVEGDPWSLLLHARKILGHHERSKASGTFPFAGAFIAFGYLGLGLYPQAEEGLSRVPEGSLEGLTAGAGRMTLLCDQGRLEEALAQAARVVEDAERIHDVSAGLLVRHELAEAYLKRGDIEAAEAQVRGLRDVDIGESSIRMWHLAVTARIRIAQGRAAEAVESAERLYSMFLTQRMAPNTKRAMFFLVRAEALHAAGDHDAARRAIGEAREDLLKRAEKIEDAEARRSFLEIPHDHRRTLELSREWLVDK